jgi:meso-butanediol dehydrogenase / (S,S)-butanediol dehydrogenase / diacetyl reductase
MLLKDKVIFLTGGSQGIGAECARAYAKEGARLAIAALDKEGIEEVIEGLVGDHLSLPCDVSNEKQVEGAIRHTLDKFGRIDAIHNNAGIAHPSKCLHDTTTEEWDRLMAVNVKSIYLTIRYGFEAIKNTRGSILNTSSMVGNMGQSLHAAYTATKGAINALTKSMALDYAVHGIRVNAVAPAGVWTPMLRNWAQEQPNTSEIESYLDQIHPLGYCPTGEVIADACVFLLSDKARFITGTILPVSGGAELGYRR